jgi:hypothetical protein
VEAVSVTTGVTLNKQEWWSLLTVEEREVVRELAEAFGPLEFVEAWKCDDVDEAAPTGS